MGKLSFSVCMSVYKGDSPIFLKQAVLSVIHQTFPPAEIIIVVDGQVPDEVSKIISTLGNQYGIIKIINLPQNKGLGNALNIAVEHAEGNIIARMDSDDISLPDRFEKQINYLNAHPECDIVGGQMTEFIDSPDNIIGKREVPLTNEDIFIFMKSRCALNHVTVMFRKEAVLKAGNYQDWFWNEDYYLWVRMMMAGCKFANIPDVVVNVRSGKDQYARRGGKRYFDSEMGIKRLMLNNGLINKKEYFVNYLERFIIQLLFPNSIRGWVYRKFARK